MNTPIVPELVVVATIVKCFPNTDYAFALPNNGGIHIRIHRNQLCQICPSLNGSSFEFCYAQKKVGFYFSAKVVIYRQNQEPSHSDYTKANAWCYLDYYNSKIPEVARKVTPQTLPPHQPLISPTSRNGKHVPEVETFSIARSSPRRKGEHFSVYREKKRRQFAEARRA